MTERSAAPDARPAAVAGTFYPASAADLSRDVAGYLAGVVPDGRSPKAIVVPHAGYRYSGAVAATAYAQLRSAAALIRRVVLLGPSHRVAFRGLAVPDVAAFETPLGQVRLDAAARAAVAGRRAVIVSDRPHAYEHSLEVQLPFLQSVLEDFALLPLVAGDASPAQVAEVLACVWGGPETLIVVSTDLSHFHADATARALDAATSAHVMRMEPCLNGEDACGYIGVNGFLLAARQRGLVPRQLGLRNSGDVTADRSSVVGYGAFAFYEPDVASS